MRADRLLSILLLLQTHERLTARQLAERLEVSERTIYRDMDALGIAGVPVLADRGVGGGWSLLESYRTDLTGLNPAEIQALFVTQSAQVLEDLGMRDAAEGALIKLRAALPTIHQRDAEFVRQRIYVDGAGWWGATDNISSLPVLQEAIWAGRKLRLTYERADCEKVERLVDPLGLVVKGAVWYLVAAAEGTLRNYRVSRVVGATICEVAASQPENFDLAAYWQQSSADFKANLPRYPVTLRVRPSAVSRLYGLRYGRVEDVEAPDTTGWQRVSVQFQVIEDACDSILGFGGLVEVIAPPELRERVVQSAGEILALYSEADHKEKN